MPEPTHTPLTMRWLLNVKDRKDHLGAAWDFRNGCEHLIDLAAQRWLDDPETDARVVMLGGSDVAVEFRGKRYPYRGQVKNAVEAIWREHHDLN